MSTVRVYSSTPDHTPLAVAFLTLETRGYTMEVRPLSDLTQALATVPRPLPRLSATQDQLLAVTLRLAEIGERLTLADAGLLRLEIGEEQGLRFETDSLRSRQRALTATLRAQQGQPAPGG